MGSKPGQVGVVRKGGEGGGEGGDGWEVGMGKRRGKKGGKGKGKMGGGEKEVIIEEERWWEVTKVLVGLWERDLREVREWEASDHVENDDKEVDLGEYLVPFLPLYTLLVTPSS